MAFDGVVISNIVSDLKRKLLDGRIQKIYQPEADELNIVIKNNRENYRLLLSADASLPLVYIMQLSKENPMTAPSFCMLLRKHIGAGRIVDICQPNFERIIEFTIEHLDEMGDLRRKKLIIEIMGKHSNIIFTDDAGMIIDSIKHISHMVSSVREVLPGRDYIYPSSGEKVTPYEADATFFHANVYAKPESVAKAIYTSITGISPLMANEICFRAGVDGGQATASLSPEEKEAIATSFAQMVADIKSESYKPNIILDGNIPVEFASFELKMYGDKTVAKREDISQVLDEYYYRKSKVTRIRQKSADLRKIVSTVIDRTSRKYDLQRKQLADTADREKYKIYGELINTYGYGVEQGAKSFVATNYYDGTEVTIPLDDTIPVLENAKKYFDKYNKKKRTAAALEGLVTETGAELEYLRSVQMFIDMTADEAALSQVKEELVAAGYVKGKGGKKGAGRLAKSNPYHFVSSDGFHMYVGKNNLQNDELTFKKANSGDMWFHAKNMPGSHVIVRLEGADDLPDATYEEAARLAAHFSAGKDAPKVEVDYTRRGNLKKPPGAKPGYVIYHTNYSMMAEPSIAGIREKT